MIYIELSIHIRFHYAAYTRNLFGYMNKKVRYLNYKYHNMRKTTAVHYSNFCNVTRAACNMRRDALYIHFSNNFECK